MKKIILAILIIIILAALLAAGIWLVSRNGDTEVEPMPTPEPTPTETTQYTPTIAPTPEQTPQNDDISEELLWRFGEGSIISRLPDMDKQENSVLLYAFSVDYSDIGHESVPANALVHAWVSSTTGEIIRFKEPSLYANIPDSMFPIPMRESVAIPYELFRPPSTDEMETIYIFSDVDVAELYKVQLRAAGFADQGSAGRVQSFWMYDRIDYNGTKLLVEIDILESGEVRIAMYINFFPWLLDN
ncbi:MAG: hypothetical protein FWE06_08530 [Oscillospiraceae bacterium]|nr:hypothetical protein [Oscillospiraceae bacterium]